jgi:hypothetical protein
MVPRVCAWSDKFSLIHQRFAFRPSVDLPDSQPISTGIPGTLLLLWLNKPAAVRCHITETLLDIQIVRIRRIVISLWKRAHEKF